MEPLGARKCCSSNASDRLGTQKSCSSSAASFCVPKCRSSLPPRLSAREMLSKWLFGESVQNTINSIADTYGKLNFVVNCAGTGYGARILGKNGPHPLDIFKLIIDLNLVGTFNVMRLGAELIDKNDPDENGEKGVIVNTASIAGYEGQIGQSAYAASKAGVIGLTITAARDLARHSIRVCTIAPGIFDTPLMHFLYFH